MIPIRSHPQRVAARSLDKTHVAACAHPFPAGRVLILLLGALFPQTGVVDPRHLAGKEREKRLPLPMSKGDSLGAWSANPAVSETDGT